MKLYCDKKSTINIVHNPIHYDCTKHVVINNVIDKHFIKENFDSGLICTPNISIGGQFVDILTKELASLPFQVITEKMGMDNTYFPA